MKLKRFVGILAAVAVIASSSTGFAATWRHSRKGQAKFPDRGGKNDYFYEDFSGTEPANRLRYCLFYILAYQIVEINYFYISPISYQKFFPIQSNLSRLI